MPSFGEKATWRWPGFFLPLRGRPFIVAHPMRPVILGIARGYNASHLRAFLRSLRRTGYQGDVALFVDGLSPDALELLHGHNVKLQVLPRRHFVQTRRHALRLAAALASPPAREEAKVALAQYYLHLVDARWVAYAQFLEATHGLYSHVMFSDVRDVVFQRDPFEFEWKAKFCSFVEALGVPIRDESHTRGWIAKGFGEAAARRLGEKLVVCAGVSLGEIDAAREYVRLMVKNLVRIDSRGLVDQGVHNYLLHTGALASQHLYMSDETPVLHLGLLPLGILRRDGEGRALNQAGQVAATVHQYAAHHEYMFPAQF